MHSRYAVLVPALLLGFWLSARSAPADELFKKPVRLMADDRVIDTGPNWGHCGPSMEDIDGDGLPDLIVGDFGGAFRFYKNVGTAGNPRFTDRGKIQAGTADAEVRIYCCVGSQPRFVDLDGDGYLDLLSNSYDPGHCYLFKGLPGHEFAAPEEIVDKAGVPVRSAPVQQQVVQSFGSFFTPVDWDADGDFDLLIGCFGGQLKLRINEGNAKEPAFAVENVVVQAGDEPLKVEGHCCPAVADWDRDGRWDLLSGSDDGSVTWFRNVGTAESPRLEKGATLVAAFDGSGENLLRWTDEQVVPGIRSQIEVVDFNGDGKLDLLLGDFCTAYDVRTDLSDEERARFDTLIAQSQAVTGFFVDRMEALRNEFAARFPGDSGYTEEANKAWSKAYEEVKNSPEFKENEQQETEIARQLREFLSSTYGDGDELFYLAKPHGYVWLLLRS